MSMFDLTRSAARAFSKNAFPLQGNSSSGTTGGQIPQATRTSRGQEDGMEGGLELSGGEGAESLQQRVRRRDMVANAATGALASGLGWVLGATPVDRQQHEQQQQQQQH